MKVFLKKDLKNRRAVISLKHLQGNSQRAIRQAFYFIGKDLVKDAGKSIMAKDKRGRLYKLIKNGRLVLHIASAPGQSPANFTGALKSSLDFNVVGSDRLEFGSRETFLSKGGVPVNLKTRKGVVYGRALELGNTDRNLEARPYLKPAIEGNYRNIRDHFERQLKKYMKEPVI